MATSLAVLPEPVAIAAPTAPPTLAPICPAAPPGRLIGHAASICSSRCLPIRSAYFEVPTMKGSVGRSGRWSGVDELAGSGLDELVESFGVVGGEGAGASAVVDTAVHASVGFGGLTALAVRDLVVGLAELGGNIAAVVLAVAVPDLEGVTERAGEEPVPSP